MAAPAIARHRRWVGLPYVWHHQLKYLKPYSSNTGYHQHQHDSNRLLHLPYYLDIIIITSCHQHQTRPTASPIVPYTGQKQDNPSRTAGYQKKHLQQTTTTPMSDEKKTPFSQRNIPSRPTLALSPKERSNRCAPAHTHITHPAPTSRKPKSQQNS